MTKEKLLGFILTPVFLVLFISTLLVFHPFLFLAYKLFGYRAHKVVLEIMNRCIVNELRLVGTKFEFLVPEGLPTDRPLIVISNHQSMYDIPLLILSLKKHHPKFIAKRELAYGLPSISYALRTMGSAIIDRKDHKQAIRAIEKFAVEVNNANHAACVFPEGTRAKDGQIKKFKSAGISTLMKHMPQALVVPVVIARNWEILKYKFLPVPFGVKVTLKVLEPLEIGQNSGKEICEKVEKIIEKELKSLEINSGPIDRQIAA